MMYYIGTILIVIVYIFLFALAFSIKEKESRRWCLGVTTLIFGMLFIIVFPSENRDAKYPYDLQYTVRLHYIDGYTQVRTFTCRGYETPTVRGERGGFIFRCGNQEIPAVIRYDVVNKKQIQKEF